MTRPTILSTTPRGVVLPGYDRLRATLRKHELRVLEPRTVEALRAAIVEADYVLGDWTGELRLDRDTLAPAKRCRLVVQPTAGFDSIDVDFAQEIGLPVANTPGANARGVAEWAVMAMLMTLKNAVLNHERTRRGEWRMVEAAEEGVFDLGGRTVGILGFGRTGREVARRVSAFGVARILYVQRSPDTPRFGHEVPVERVADVDELCRRSDVLSIHVPLTPATRHLIDGHRLKLLGPGAVLVNTSRGAVVDEDALHAALGNGELKAAALDVFSDEPLTGAHRWRELGNVMLSPHLSGSTVESRERMISGALRSLDGALAGVLPESVVNGVGALRVVASG
ncbi:2-hydroxyacid dehydrogenase [Saccharomonospora sp. NPDC046836]|uniref:2-hydroxyacid dehydrogenase n=1 Tax=Saccharomonospora sp. NPDC046836 TaxID=3156921 RepID=UPI003405E8B9